jgi:hypothetical protein
MNPNRYRQMGPPAGVCLKPSKEHAPPFRPPGPSVLPAELREALAAICRDAEARLAALLGPEAVIATLRPAVLTGGGAEAQTWSGDIRLHLLVHPTPKDRS